MPVLRNVGRQLEVGDVVNRLGHTLSGVAVGVWSLPVAPIVGVAGSVVWVAATTGFALAPDLDHPASTAAIPGRDADWAALGVKGRPRPQVRATRDAEPPYDVHLELVDEDDEA